MGADILLKASNSLYPKERPPQAQLLADALAPQPQRTAPSRLLTCAAHPVGVLTISSLPAKPLVAVDSLGPANGFSPQAPAPLSEGSLWQEGYAGWVSRAG